MPSTFGHYVCKSADFVNGYLYFITDIQCEMVRGYDTGASHQKNAMWERRFSE
jgi:hypothetical protein